MSTGQTKLPDEAWLEVAKATCDDRPAGIPFQSFERPQQIWQIRHGTSQHPLSSLAQTSVSFCQMLAPIIYSHLAIVSADTMSITQASLLIQLVRTLDRKIVRRTLQSLSVDFRILDSDMAWGCRQLEESWDGNHEVTDFFPEIQDFINVENELATRLNGLNLKHFEWRGYYRPTAAIYEALGKLESLESVALDWSYFTLPGANPPYEPDSLDQFSQVKAAALGLGKVMTEGGRGNDYEDGMLIHREVPGLFDFLTGSNKLRYLYLAAPLLYYQKYLIPCWAKDDALSKEEIPENSTSASATFGELSQLENYEESTDDEESQILAAINFRQLLKKKALSSSSRPLNTQDVVDVIHEEELLKPWRKWFAKDCLTIDRIEQDEEVEMTNGEIFERVIERWNESEKDEMVEKDRERFSKKSTFLLDVK